MDKKYVTQGNIYMCDFSGAKGSEQKGTRPVLVVTSNIANQFSNIIIVVPLTSKNKNTLPIHYTLYKKKYPLLSEDSIVLCEQIKAIDKDRLGKYMGKINTEDLKNVIKTINENFTIHNN